MKDQHFLFAIGLTDCLKMTASLQWVSQKWPHFENPTVNTTTNRKYHSSFVTFDLWPRCMNLANEIPFFWHVALTTGFSLDFKWYLDFGSFFLALSFLFFTYLVHCFQFWKVWNTELFVVKSASHERSAFFVCNRPHWLPKDDCIFAVGFPKMTTFWKPNSEYYNKQKMPFIFCHIRFVTAMHEPGWWNSFLMACCTYKKFLSRFQMRSLLWIFLPGFKLFVFHLSCSLPLTLKSLKQRAVCTKICQTWKISIFCLQ